MGAQLVRRASPALRVGNHEFYGHAVDTLIDDLRRSAAGSSVHVLENDELVIHGVRYLGCTLWSDFDFAGADRRTESMLLAERVVNDYGQIEFGSGGRPLTPDNTRQLHLSSRRWLKQRLGDGHPGPTVVVTHHAPLIRTRPSSPALRALAGTFANDVTELMSGDRVSLWIFGHTHRVADLELHGTHVVSNPRAIRISRSPGSTPAAWSRSTAVELHIFRSRRPVGSRLHA